MWICSKYHSHSLMPLLEGGQFLLPILQAEQGPFLSSCSYWTQQSCAVHPCALLQAKQGPLKGQHFCSSAVYLEALVTSAPWRRELSLCPLILHFAAGGCVHGGRVGFGVGCVFNSSLSQMCCGTLLESSCSHSRVRVEEVAVMKVPDFPVLQRDIAPGAAAQVDVVMDFWQADPHGSMGYGEASDPTSSSCCQSVLPGRYVLL